MLLSNVSVLGGGSSSSGEGGSSIDESAPIGKGSGSVKGIYDPFENPWQQFRKGNNI